MVLASAKVTGWTGLHTSGVAVAWHMAWRSSLVHVSLVAGVPAWALRYSFSLLGGAVPLSRQQMPGLWGISASLFSWRFHGSGGPPMVFTASKKVACAGSLASWVPRCGRRLAFEYPPFGEFSWRFGVASGLSLCRTAEGLPRCCAGCLLSWVTPTDFLFFLQPWARWPSVRSGKPWRHSRDMG